MPSDRTTDTVAVALTGAFVVSVLLWGYFVVQQLLLSAFVALLGVLAYVTWRYVRASGGGESPLA